MRIVSKIKSKLWLILILLLAVAGILLILYNRIFNSSAALNVGVILFSVAGIMIGIEAIIQRKIILKAPYHRCLSETYTGIAAIAQGLLIIVTGCFLIMLIIVNHLNAGRNLFQHFIEHPGIPLIFISAFCILTAVFTSIGSVEDKQGSKFTIIQNLLASRLLPSIILIGVGTIFFFLGILEIINPIYFDSLGGGFLELLFVKQD